HEPKDQGPLFFWDPKQRASYQKRRQAKADYGKNIQADDPRGRRTKDERRNGRAGFRPSSFVFRPPHLSLNAGRRFSRKAVRPSRKSSVGSRPTKLSRSNARPSSRRAPSPPPMACMQ